jgi:ATP-dependent Zn protease
MAVLCVFSALTFKMVMNQLNKPAVSSIDLKGTIYSNGTHFRDYYGGEDIKEKFKEIIDFIRYP